MDILGLRLGNVMRGEEEEVGVGTGDGGAIGKEEKGGKEGIGEEGEEGVVVAGVEGFVKIEQTDMRDEMGASKEMDDASREEEPDRKRPRGDGGGAAASDDLALDEYEVAFEDDSTFADIDWSNIP